jgi:hypothetical protein
MTSDTADRERRAAPRRAGTLENDRRIGARIRERRILLGLTLHDLATNLPQIYLTLCKGVACQV